MTDRSYVPALGFHLLTPLYDVVVARTTRERAFKQALLEQAGLAGGQQVLDLACGTATLSLWAAHRQPGLSLTGLDGDPRMLARAAAKASRAGVALKLDQGHSTAMPYPDAHFDVVLSSLFFHHLLPEDKARTLIEVRRVLKPGGQLHVADWGRARNPIMRAAFYAIQALDGFPNTRDHVEGRLPDFLGDAGFTDVVETRHFSTMWGTLTLLRGIRPTRS